MTEMQEEEIDLREYINVLIKRKGVIILIFLIAVITAALVSYFVLTPIYQSSISFLVNRELVRQQYYYPASSVNPYISDILILLTRDLILKEAVEKINLDYKYGEIREKVEANNIEDTNIITLTVEDKDPKIAKDLANYIVKIFIEKNQFKYDEKRKIAEENLKIYKEQLDDVERNIIEIEKMKQKVAISAGVPDVEKHFQTSLLLNSLVTERNTRNFLISKVSSIKEDLMNYQAFKIIEPAVEPISPIKPNKELNILIAGVLGLFVGIFVAFFLEFWQKGKS